MPVRMLPNNPQQTTISVETARDLGLGVGAAWRERDEWKSRTMSLARYVTETDAAVFAIGMVLKELPSILSKTSHRTAEVATKSGLALAEIQNPHRWVQSSITDAKVQATRVKEGGGALALTWLPSSVSSNGYKTASTTAQRAARQQPRAMRSASLLYVKRAIRARWKPATKLNEHVKDTRKSVAARHLQLKSGHAITDDHLNRIGKAGEARCWWCSERRQSVAHLLLECRKWRRRREVMLRSLKAEEITLSETRQIRETSRPCLKTKQLWTCSNLWRRQR